MDDELTTLLRIAMAAQALLDRLDNITTEAFNRGGDLKERETLRAALRQANPPTWSH